MREKRLLRNQSQDTKKRIASSVKRDNFFGAEGNAAATNSAKTFGLGGNASSSSKAAETKDTVIDTNLRDVIIDKMLFEKRQRPTTPGNPAHQTPAPVARSNNPYVKRPITGQVSSRFTRGQPAAQSA